MTEQLSKKEQNKVTWLMLSKMQKNIFRMATTKREIILIGQLGKSLDVEEYIIPVGSWLYGLCECLFLEAVFHEVSVFSLSAYICLFLYYLC